MHEKATWNLIPCEDKDGLHIYRMMVSPPDDLDLAQFSQNVSIEWRYADSGMADSETGETMRQFEGLLAGLDNVTGNSVLTFVYTGRGKREWSYYARDYNRFLIDLNHALAGKPRFPIEIIHTPDPMWEYWRRIRDMCVSMK
jgi:hypothetical protein